jgi:FlaA1/EpsC-like NDP-sugar epimerase
MGFLDDDRTKRNKWFMEYRVLGNRYDIETLSKIYPVDEVIIAISNIELNNLNQLILFCQKACVGYSIFRAHVNGRSDDIQWEIASNKKIIQKLNSKELKIDFVKYRNNFNNSRFLVIGPSNVIGLELLKCIVQLYPKKIILLDRYESYLNETLQLAYRFIPKERIKPALSIDALPISTEKILSSNNYSDIVIHMGTRKHSRTLFEIDPLHIVKENILNTWDLFQVVRAARCKLFAITSTIGAENPENFTQATLRLIEHYIQSTTENSPTRSLVVRLCNLFENKGSILHKMQIQLKNGQKILLNHPKEHRYFITAASAARMMVFAIAVKLKSKFDNEGVFIPLINEPIKISDLAKFILQELGLEPDIDVEIEYAHSDNQREWEQELHLNYKLLQETEHESIKNIPPSYIFSETQICDDIQEFRDLIKRKDRDKVIKKVEHILHKILAEEYKNNKNKLSAVNY